VASLVTPRRATGHYVFSSSEKHTLGFGAVVGLYVTGVAIGLIPNSLQLPCPTYKFIGLQCPGCGLTRAGSALLHGHLVEALRFNPLAIWVGSYVVYRFAAMVYGIQTRRHLIQHFPRWTRRLFINTFAVGVLVLALLRLYAWGISHVP
jgi:hypothetical protein